MSSETLTPELIEQEIEAAGEITDYLNNFILRFDWKERAIMTNRKLMELFGEMDMLNSDRFPENTFERSQYSPLFLSQTPKEFFATIDELVATLGIDTIIDQLLGKRMELQTKHREVSNGDLQENPDVISAQSRDNLHELNIAVKPVYIQMRLKGYNHADLTS